MLLVNKHNTVVILNFSKLINISVIRINLSFLSNIVMDEFWEFHKELWAQKPKVYVGASTYLCVIGDISWIPFLPKIGFGSLIYSKDWRCVKAKSEMLKTENMVTRPVLPIFLNRTGLKLQEFSINIS
jgi:hypothetical protein